ncbi:MAG: 30S ribosomal protein S7 [Parcubacteria group bacterium]
MRKKIKKKIVAKPDRKYNSLLVSRLINQIMHSGKKTIAEKIVYSTFERLEKQTKKPALEILEVIITNAGPQVELRSRRVGGANYQVPHEVKTDRKVTLAFRWIVDAARKAKGKPMAERLYTEMLGAYNNEGTAIKKRSDIHRMADANKAFAHFAWGSR